MANHDQAKLRPALVFFAVKEEGLCFQPPPGVEVRITGMGSTNARRAAKAAFGRHPPSLVLSCGFAGGLDPALRLNDLLLDADDTFLLRERLIAAGARPGRFHCAERIAVTVMEKAELRRVTGADAVEMESAVIRELCRAHGIPSATLRVISDTANVDLPLDFNTIMTPDLRMSGSRLTGALIRSPGHVPKLMRFRKQVSSAARTLAQCLQRALSVDAPR